MIIEGDCLEVMKTFPDNHFSGIVTDPPYGLHFMGKDWDQFKFHSRTETPKHGRLDADAAQAFKAGSYDPKRDDEFQHFITQVALEALRITKPGGHLVMFGAPRRYHRQACAIEDAGWEIRDCLFWCFGSGFPKSHNKFGIEGFGTALKPAYEPILLAMKPLDGTFKQNAEKWGVAGLNIDACRVLSGVEHFRPEVKRRGSTFLNERKGMYTEGRGFIPTNSDKGRWPANVILDEEAGKMLDEQSGVLKSGNLKPYRRSSGGGYHGSFPDNTQFRPPSAGGASRFFFIARNDIIDACQLPAELLSVGKKMESASSNLNTDMFGSEPMGLFRPDTISITKTETRSIMIFPILSASRQTLIGTCTLECEKIIEPLMALNIEAVSFVENGSVSIHFRNESVEPIKAIVKNVPENDWLNGERKTGNIGTNIISGEEKTLAMNTTRNISKKTALRSMHREEKDTPKRFFYCAKTSSRERSEGLENKSTHPTVKPLALMRYLITLISPLTNALILDPFAGSGSTVVAAHQLGIKCIGIEKQTEYAEIARKRVENAITSDIIYNKN